MTLVCLVGLENKRGGLDYGRYEILNGRAISHGFWFLRFLLFSSFMAMAFGRVEKIETGSGEEGELGFSVLFCPCLRYIMPRDEFSFFFFFWMKKVWKAS